MSNDNNIIKYCKIRFRLMSPLEIGSGTNANTDHDIIVTGNGTPFIPGSAIAGYFRDAIFRALLQEKGKIEARKEVFEKLGYVIIETDKTQENQIDQQSDFRDSSRESSVIFYDAFINEEVFHKDSRDLVALDDNKVSLPGAKFDTEILEPDVTFDTYLEEYLTEGEESIIDRILHIWSSEDVAFGSKTTRGMGLTKLEQVWIREFDLNDEESVKAWVDFSVYSDSSKKAFAPEDEKTSTYVSLNNNDASKCVKDEWVLSISLKQIGGISIRKYTTAVSSPGHSEPDYEQMAEHIWEAEKKDADDLESNCTWKPVIRPVIPGSTWAGAFRHHMKNLMGANESQMDRWFGFVKGKGKEKSIIQFSDSVLKNAKSKNLSRNAIDRFTGGTVDGALFTERTYFGGETELIIRLKKDLLDYYSDDESTAEEQKYNYALAATVADLHAGYLAIGGLTAVGRGVFEVTGINGQKFSGNTKELYDMVLSILCKKEAKGTEEENVCEELKLAVSVMELVTGSTDSQTDGIQAGLEKVFACEASNEVYYAATLTDVFMVGLMGDVDSRKLIDTQQVKKLLELRIFSKDAEIKAWRSDPGGLFQVRVMDDKTASAYLLSKDRGEIIPMSDYFDETQMIDIDRQRSEGVDHVGTIGHVKATGGGAFKLPAQIFSMRNPGLIVRHYFGMYEQSGNAYIRDWRCVGFRNIDEQQEKDG